MMGNRRGRGFALVLGSLLAAPLLANCSGQLKTDATSDGGPGAGAERGACYPNDTCNAGLTCLSHVCVSAGADGSVDPFPMIDGSLQPVDGGDNQWETSAPFDAGSVTTLYERLGTRAGIASLTKQMFEGANGELADAQLLSYFYIRTGGIGSGAGGAPSLAVVEDCFTQFIAKATGGPEAYPFTSVAGGANFVCRDMATAHAGLGATSAAFQKFVTIFAATCTAAGVSQSDLQTLGGAILGTASDIVDQARNKAQQEAGVDAAHSYGARCSDIVGGAATAPGCTTP